MSAPTHLTAEAYLTVASIMAGFGVTVLMFRIQRELTVENNPDDPDLRWLPWADWLILGSIVLSLGGVVFPLVAADNPEGLPFAFAAACCAAASLLLVAYPFAILDHYRLVWGKGRWRKSMRNTIAEPGEKIIVVTTFIAAILALAGILCGRLS
jgi:hypothetical protein